MEFGNHNTLLGKWINYIYIHQVKWNSKPITLPFIALDF